MKILLTGGGSGGPTTPLLALYEELKTQLGEDLHGTFMGTEEGPERAWAESLGMSYQSIPSGKLRRYWSWQNFRDPFRILAGFFVALWRVWQIQPDVVVSAGSFVSVPVAYVSRLLGIKHVLLQMDVRPGLANRLMVPASSQLAYLFPETLPFFQRISSLHIGPVLRQSIREASAQNATVLYGLSEVKPLLLVTGGGQGAVSLNRAVEQMLPLWIDSFQVVHLTGKGNAGAAFSHPDYHHFPFISQGMGDLLARSDLVITRAGLGILGELAYLAKDAILVPIPQSHQEENAEIVSRHHAAEFLPQKVLLEDGIAWWNFFLARYQPGVLGENLHRLFPAQGTEVFAQLVIQEGQTSSC